MPTSINDGTRYKEFDINNFASLFAFRNNPAFLLPEETAMLHLPKKSALSDAVKILEKRIPPIGNNPLKIGGKRHNGTQKSIVKTLQKTTLLLTIY